MSGPCGLRLLWHTVRSSRHSVQFGDRLLEPAQPVLTDNIVPHVSRLRGRGAAAWKMHGRLVEVSTARGDRGATRDNGRSFSRAQNERARMFFQTRWKHPRKLTRVGAASAKACSGQVQVLDSCMNQTVRANHRYYLSLYSRAKLIGELILASGCWMSARRVANESRLVPYCATKYVCKWQEGRDTALLHSYNGTDVGNVKPDRKNDISNPNQV